MTYDTEVNIQEQALNLIRNVACGRERDIELVVKGLGVDTLTRILEAKLVDIVYQENIVLQALYILVNLATGSDAHKGIIMGNNKLLRVLKTHLVKKNVGYSMLTLIIN